MKCIKGRVAELRRKKWSIHAGRSGAEENMTAGEESLDDLEAGVSGQSRCCGKCRLRGEECLGVEERQHIGKGEARKLRRTRRASAVALSTPETCRIS